MAMTSRMRRFSSSSLLLAFGLQLALITALSVHAASNVLNDGERLRAAVQEEGRPALGQPLKVFVNSPSIGYSHMQFQGRLADLLVEAGHTVVSVLHTVVLIAFMKRRCNPDPVLILWLTLYGDLHLHLQHVYIANWNPAERRTGTNKAQRVIRINATTETRFGELDLFTDPFQAGNILFQMKRAEPYRNTTTQFCRGER